MADDQGESCQRATLSHQPPHGAAHKYCNGAISGLVEVTTTHWIDVLKTRLQAEKETVKNINIRSLTKRIWLEEGFLGLYRGYLSRLAGIGPMRACFWGTMDIMNLRLADTSLNESTRLVIAGAGGGFIQSICDVPIEVAKTHFMTSSNESIKSVILESAKFRGGIATFSRNIIFAMIMNTGINYQREHNSSSAEIMARAAISGIVASFVTQPFDYIKTQQQKIGGLHQINAVRLLIITARKSVPLLWTGFISRAILSITTMSVGGTVFKLLAQWSSASPIHTQRIVSTEN